MRRIFADALYWVALAHRKDQWHTRAVQASHRIGAAILVTTDEVLTEFLNHFSAYGEQTRTEAARTVRDFLNDPAMVVVPQSRQTLLAGLALYEARRDKEYGLTDCISMVTMRQEGIQEVLTHDDHFAQEGFIRLL
jgi:predicted nucleic acid-binding protein